MDQPDKKKQLVIPIITFLIGAIIGSILTLFLFPNECSIPEEETEIEIIEEEQVKSSTDKVIIEDHPIESESLVSLPISDCSITIDIAGAVKDPGVYCFKEGSKIVDAIKRASGFIDGVAYKYVAMKMNLSSLLTNHQKIYIPFEEDVYCELKNLQYIDTPKTNTQQAETEDNTSDSTQTCININTATKEQLISLNGIGESTAQKIIDARPYSKVEDILNVSGIGDATYEKFKNDICVY
jgi:competence protein ComEA